MSSGAHADRSSSGRWAGLVKLMQVSSPDSQGYHQPATLLIQDQVCLFMPRLNDGTADSLDRVR